MIFRTWLKSLGSRELEHGGVFSNDVSRHKKTVERILTKNIIPFWYPHVIDWQKGGFHLNHGCDGIWKGPALKALVTQARTVWFFSRLVNMGSGQQQYLEAAKHGYTFLRDCMWDKRYGGFYWEVDPTGKIATKPNKHLYGQAFGLYALSEYAQATGDSSAIELARDLFNKIDRHAHDPSCGGYQEYFREDWSPVSGETSCYMGASAEGKSLNTHLHLMEALTTFYRLTCDSKGRERLWELVLVQANTVVRKTLGACTDAYRSDWTPVLDSGLDRVSYGHDLENVYLLIEACETLGLPHALHLDLYRTLFEYSLHYGFDQKYGGFFESGPFNAPADKRNKIWWVQAESLVSALQMYRLTREKKYWNCFSQTLAWIEKHQVDWEHGDWHWGVGENGTVFGDKAGEWKSPYHNGRAMMSCLELLSSLH